MQASPKPKLGPSVRKPKAFASRYKVRKRRHRQHKTNYHKRKKLITQDKTKFGAPKYRFVVRFTNKDICCQIVQAHLTHDTVVAASYSHELKRYGLNVGLTNYSAAYCTGLLIARRLNEKLKLNYEGTTEVTGDEFLVEENAEGPRPFKAFLDTGIKNATAGGNLFGALKGACDGGLYIPHNNRKFPGSSNSKDEGKRRVWEYDAGMHRERIMGQHVASYMRQMKEDDEQRYEKHFSQYIKAGFGPDDIEDMYMKVHEEIRKNPSKPRGEDELGNFKGKSTRKPKKAMKTNQKRLSSAERKAKIQEKLENTGAKDLGVAVETA